MTIKDLVFDLIKRTGGKISERELSAVVKAHFPDSRWNKTHFAYYRSQIVSANGRFTDQFDDEVKRNLAQFARAKKGGDAKDPVKQMGDAILRDVRAQIKEFAGDDEDLQFRLNRWIFSRLQLDERRGKSELKKQLWEKGVRSCTVCGKIFETLKNVEAHRPDGAKAYSSQNIVLLCRTCHRKEHYPDSNRSDSQQVKPAY